PRSGSARRPQPLTLLLSRVADYTGRLGAVLGREKVSGTLDPGAATRPSLASVPYAEIGWKEQPMKVLITYASRHGSTAGIAERVADVIGRAGLTVDLQEVEAVTDPESYDAFVIGGAAYMFHWLRPVTAFVKHNHRLLSRRPTWLFSSGPLGTDLV